MATEEKVELVVVVLLLLLNTRFFASVAGILIHIT